MATPARSKKSAVSAKSSSSTTTVIAAPAGCDTNPAIATTPALSTASSAPNTTIHLVYKDGPGPSSTSEVSDDLDHRPNQPYHGAAPLRQIQQSPNLSGGQSHPSPYTTQGVFGPQAGLQSPYLNNSPQFQQRQQPSENAYYTSNPSPRSTTSAAYYSSDKPDSMAAATATMHRPPYPSIYHTPQSNSPASVTSPQTHDQNRSMFATQPPQMQPSMYTYSNYQHMNPVHQSPYAGHQHPHQMNQQPMLSYNSNPNTMNQGAISNQASTISSSPSMKTEPPPPPPPHYAQTPQSQPGLLPSRQSTGGTPSSVSIQSTQPQMPPSTTNAAPGPIPATTPLVVRQDQNGVQWIAFEYSRDRVKMEYTIRCDVESVDANELTQEFKADNCVYPRACVPKDQYKGNRLAYETDCNSVGWALANLNPCLRGKRGLIQRAVDSWRNSNQDPRLRSRRVRRQAKMNSRSKMGSLNSQTPGPPGPGTAGIPGPALVGVPSTRPPGKLPHSSSQAHHHHVPHEGPSSAHESVGGPPYSAGSGLQRSSSTSQHLTSPNDLRQAHTFPGYSAYPSVPTTLGPSMPPSLPGNMHGYGRTGGSNTMSLEERNETHGRDLALFGDAKHKYFVPFEDVQNNTRGRLKVKLDQIHTSEMPDSYREKMSVYPRAYYPIQMQASAAARSDEGRFIKGESNELDDGPPTVGRIAVPCDLPEGKGEVEIPQLSSGRCGRERKLNELGYCIAWGQTADFADRPLFLSRALDTYRQHRTVTIRSDNNSSEIPPHLETRPGKRRWLERSRSALHTSSPVAPISSL